MSDASRKFHQAAAVAGRFVLTEVKKAVRQYFRPVTAAFETRPSDQTSAASPRRGLGTSRR